MSRFERWAFRVGLLLTVIGGVQGHWLSAAIGTALVGMSLEDKIFGKED